MYIHFCNQDKEFVFSIQYTKTNLTAFGGSLYSFGESLFALYFLIRLCRANNNININITTTVLAPSTEPVATPMIKAGSSSTYGNKPFLYTHIVNGFLKL